MKCLCHKYSTCSSSRSVASHPKPVGWGAALEMRGARVQSHVVSVYSLCYSCTHQLRGKIPSRQQEGAAWCARESCRLSELITIRYYYVENGPGGIVRNLKGRWKSVMASVSPTQRPTANTADLPAVHRGDKRWMTTEKHCSLYFQLGPRTSVR